MRKRRRGRTRCIPATYPYITIMRTTQSVGIAAGVAIGVAIGMLLDNVGAGIAIGIAIAIAAGWIA